MKTIPFLPQSPRAGYSLLVTLVLTAVATVILGATLQRSMTGSKLNDRTDQYMVASAAAEAATEKVMSRMAVDFANGGEVALTNNMAYYRNSMQPSSSESSFWTNFQFTDGQGNVNQTFVARIDTNINPPYVKLLQQYPGLSAFACTYRVLSNVKYTNSNYGFTAAVDQDLQMAEIPVFQFAIFYNTLLEFSDCAPFDISGRVHCNTNIYVGTVNNSHLTFNYTVTTSGIITNPAWAGFVKSDWLGGPITYNGTPTPGYGTHAPVLTLPVGTNNTPAAVRQILYPPPAGESTTNPISSQRFFNTAYMIITVTNPVVVASTNTPITSANYSVSIAFKNAKYDASPSYIYLGTNISKGTNVVNWNNSGVGTWLSTNKSFYDQREDRTNQVTQIDIGNLGIWLGNSGGAITNTNCTGKWGGGVTFNGVLYVQDLRDTNSNVMDCIRLVNGVAITNGLYNTGLTVATPNPLYIWGIYNCPKAAYQGTTNTTLSRPTSVVCDALTILSPAWSDANSKPALAIDAQDDTVNTAIIAGNVLSTDATGNGFSGGVMNLTRLLEDWRRNNTLTLNSSIINLYNSVQATKQFQMPGNYYYAPNRQFAFDLNFTTSTGLPPGTPLVNQMIRASWCNPKPGDVAFTNPPQLFVPH